MAQTGYTPIQLYYSTTAAAVPVNTNLASGELAINITDGKLYYKDNGGTVRLLASNATSAPVLSFSAGTTGFTPSTATTGAITLAGTLATANGGTNLTSFTSGGVVYASSTSALATGSALTFDGTNLGVTGRASLGTSPPTSGTLAIKADASADAISIAGRAADGVANINLFANNGTTYQGYISATSAGVNFGIGSGAIFGYTTTGVGIGTSSPAQKLDVSGSGVISARITSTSSNATLILNSASGFYNYLQYTSAGSGGLILYDTTNSANRVILDSAGNLGLGVTPSAWTIGKVIQAGSTSAFWDYGGTAYLSSNRYFGGGNKRIASGYATSYEQDSSTGNHVWAIAGTGAADSAISFTQAMTLDTSGNLGVGTTSPSYRLDVKGATGENATLAQFASGTNAARGLTLGLSAGGTGINDAFAVYNSTIAGGYAGHIWQAAGTERARITPNGGFSVGTTADPGAGAIYATGNITAYYSDARLKTVSGKIENALDKVAQLSGVYYTNNSVAKSFGYDSDEVQVGVLAQDVEAVLPQIVKAAPFDLDQDGNSKSGENYKTVQYERLVPLLIEAINELQAKVKALEAR